MNYDIGACKNCGKIAGVTKDHKCKACGAERETVPLYTWFHQNYDLIENLETIDRIDEMDNTEIKASGVGSAALKAGLRDLLISIGIAVALLLFGLLCIKGAGGPVKGRMSFMGILFLIASPIMLIVGIILFFNRAFSKARAKTPEKAFELFWKAIFETKTFSFQYEDPKIASDKLARSLPAAVRGSMDDVQFQSWLIGLRSKIGKSNGDLALDCFRAYKEDIGDAKGEDDTMVMQNITTETIDEHKAVVSAELVISRKWTRSYQHGNNTDYYNYQMAAGILHAQTTLLKAGEYWYVPDWMPKIEPGETVNGWKEANS